MDFKFNIPNKITIIRVGLIPLFAIILFVNIPYKHVLAAFIFGMLSISDFLDGYFARKKKQITEFGKLIDPIADKLLISTALIFLIGKGIELWMVIAIIAREVIITAIRIYLLPMRIVVPASIFGKVKTFVQSIAIVFVLLKLPLSSFLMLAAVLITIISGLEYIIRIRQMTGNKVVNLPNLITLARFLLIIPFIYYFLNSSIHISILLFAVITLSDKLDGISARLMNQKTELGSAIDSFTDWTLIITTFVLLVIKKYIDVSWLALLSIPSIISGLMKILYAKKQKVLPVTLAARLSVGSNYVTIIAILINFKYYMHLLLASTIMIYWATIVYIFKVLNLPKNLSAKNKEVAKI
ncbi:MAG: CDP-diacylglycerol--glycerol-3-phosphate 3-phosphatidyltransferase [Nanoarchaeota archaeon]